MAEFSEKQKETMTRLNRMASENTVEARAASWIKNVTLNREHFKAGNPPLLGMTVFVVGAGPSLRKNIADLKKVGKLGVIVCVEAAFRYLMEQGVVPDYCVSIDADSRMLSMIEGADTSSPNLVAHWKGPRYFLRATGGSKDLDEKLHAAHRVVKVKRDLKVGDSLDPLADIEVEFPGLNEALTCGGNVTSYAHSFALSLLRAVRVVFVGADYSWTDVNDFYAGGAHKMMSKERMEGENIFNHADSNGLTVTTNFTLFHLKTWHEEVAVGHPGHCFNATEGGILGVGKMGQPLAGWEILTLKDAVARFAPLPAPAREAVPA